MAFRSLEERAIGTVGRLGEVAPVAQAGAAGRLRPSGAAHVAWLCNRALDINLRSTPNDQAFITLITSPRSTNQASFSVALTHHLA
jgi:hypothetical protein